MNKILAPVTDKNGNLTRRWVNQDPNVGINRLRKMMSGEPVQPVSFSKEQIPNAKLDQLTRFIDEAVLHNRLDDFAVEFAHHPQLPALYQTLLIQKENSPALAEALVENPNASVSTIQNYYENPQNARSFQSAVTHPLLPIDIAVEEYDNDFLEGIRRSLPEWATRAEAQIERVKAYLGSRPI